MSYTEKSSRRTQGKNPGEKEFHQAATEVLESLTPVVEAHPEYEECALLERLVEARAYRYVPRSLG